MRPAESMNAKVSDHTRGCFQLQHQRTVRLVVIGIQAELANQTPRVITPTINEAGITHQLPQRRD
jgi:hypothetical protein